MAKVILALGSNLGDRPENLRKAVFKLEEKIGSSILSSSMYETDPVGVADIPFLNAVVRFNTKIVPEQLLQTIKSIEREMGRDMNAPRWSNRLIDLDIIIYGNDRIQDHELQIPHPEYRDRLFVLIPLQEIDPDYSDPFTQKSISEMISSAPQLGIYKTDVKW